MKFLISLLMGAFLSQSVLAESCTDQSLANQAAQFDLSGNIRFENKSSGDVDTISMARHSKGDEMYDYFKEELSSDFELISDVYTGQESAVFFTQEKSSCKVMMMVTAGDEPAVYAVDTISDKSMSLIDIYNNDRLLLIKESL